jgi:hypothetical protein
MTMNEQKYLRFSQSSFTLDSQATKPQLYFYSAPPTLSPSGALFPGIPASLCFEMTK